MFHLFCIYNHIFNSPPREPKDLIFLCRVIDQLWQSVGHFITHLLNTKVEPLIQKSLEGFSLKDFKFDHVLLGSSPPRIGGLKCYDKNYTSRSEIILDLEVRMDSLFPHNSQSSGELGKRL